MTVAVALRPLASVTRYATGVGSPSNPASGEKVTTPAFTVQTPSPSTTSEPVIGAFVAVSKKVTELATTVPMSLVSTLTDTADPSLLPRSESFFATGGSATIVVVAWSVSLLSFVFRSVTVAVLSKAVLTLPLATWV